MYKAMLPWEAAQAKSVIQGLNGGNFMRSFLFFITVSCLLSQDCGDAINNGEKYSKACLDDWSSPQMTQLFELQDDIIISKDITRTGIDTIFIPTFLEQGRQYRFEYSGEPLKEKLVVTRINFTDVCYKYEWKRSNQHEFTCREGIASIRPTFWFGSETEMIEDSISVFDFDSEISVAEYWDTDAETSFSIRISYPDQMKYSNLLVWINDERQNIETVSELENYPLKQVD